MEREEVSFAFLQESHLEDKDNIKLKRGWVGQVFATSYSSFSRGVAILVSSDGSCNTDAPTLVSSSPSDAFIGACVALRKSHVIDTAAVSLIANAPNCV